MKIILLVLTLIGVCTNLQAKDRLDVYEDFDIGTELVSMTMVKVDPNMEDMYLAGLQQSWAKAVQIQKDMGYIKDWKIYASELPLTGDFNMLLVVTYEKLSDLEPSKKKYEAESQLQTCNEAIVLADKTPMAKHVVAQSEAHLFFSKNMIQTYRSVHI